MLLHIPFYCQVALYTPVGLSSYLLMDFGLFLVFDYLSKVFMNKVAMKHVLHVNMYFHFSWINNWEWNCWVIWKACLTLKKKKLAHCFPKCLYPSSLLPSSVWEFHLSYILANICYCQSLAILYAYGGISL